MSWRVALGLFVLGLGVVSCLGRNVRAIVRAWPTGDAGESRVVRVEKTMGALKSQLPSQGVVGYRDWVQPVSSWGDESHYTFLMAQYSLAPLVLERDGSSDTIVLRAPDGFAAPKLKRRGRP